MAAVAPDSVEFLILGPLEARRGGDSLDLRGEKQRALLAVLLLNANRVVPVERLIDELWGEAPPQTAANTLQVHVSQLRKILESSAAPDERLLQTRPPGYAAVLREGQLDLHTFERLLVEGREAVLADELELGAERLRAALELWRGPCMAGLSLQGPALATIGGLHELQLAVYEDLIATELALGRHVGMLPTLEALVAEHPFRESLRGQLMLALYRSGRQADALEAFRLARQTLVEELGIEPGRELQRLETAILQQDPVLDAAPQARPYRPNVPPRREPPPAPEPADRRKPIVVAVTDLVVEVDGPALDAERLREVRRRAVELVSSCVARHHGLIYRVAGERVIAVFGAATAHEDDALRAVRAVADAASALAAVADDRGSERPSKVGMRAGIEAGVALVGRDDAGDISIDGSALLVGERAAAFAASGEILLGPTAQVLLGEAVHVESPAEDTERSFVRLVEIDPRPVSNARHDTPLVGRRSELAELHHMLARARDSSRCLLVTLLGEAGIGKSRLALELAREGEAVRVVRGACRAYGEAITFAPLADIVADLVGGPPDVANLAAVLPADDEAERIAHVIVGALGGEEPAGTAEEVFRAARRLLEFSAQARPLLVVLDDLHWAEPTFLDLVEHIAERSREAPIMLLCLARPELLEERPSWGSSSVSTATLLLEPLTEIESRALVDEMLDQGDVVAETKARIVSLAGGNPFFVEQLLAVASQEPGYAAQLSSPPTVQALLAARLDRLPSGERLLLEHASVVGMEFAPDVLAGLLSAALAETASAHLAQLRQRRLIVSREAGLRNPDSYAFAHALIREAAYESLPKGRRSVLHRQLAEWFESQREQPAEIDELTGYHLEQAYLYAQEVRQIAEDDRVLARQAAAHLTASARRADAIGDMPKVVSLLSRAERLLAADDPARAATLAELAEALRDVGELERAEVTLRTAVDAAVAARDEAAEARAVAVRWQVRLQTDPAVSFEEATTAIAATIDKLAALGHERGLAKAWVSLAEVPFLRGQAAASEEALERGLAYARSAGDRRTEAMATNLLIGASVSGPMPVPAAIRRCNEIVEQTGGEGRVAATALRALAGLSAMEGRFADAWGYVERDRAILRDLGFRVVASSSAMIAGLVGILAGEPTRAEAELRWGFEILEEMGDRNGLATVAASLAEVVLAQDRLKEALFLTALSRDAAAPEDLTVQVAWRGPHAKAIARTGQLDDAERLARAAVKLAEQTDFLDLHGNALLDLAEVLRLGGQTTAATSTASEAALLFERKGNLVSLARAQAAATNRSLAPA